MCIGRGVTEDFTAQTTSLGSGQTENSTSQTISFCRGQTEDSTAQTDLILTLQPSTPSLSGDSDDNGELSPRITHQTPKSPHQTPKYSHQSPKSCHQTTETDFVDHGQHSFQHTEDKDFSAPSSPKLFLGDSDLSDYSSPHVLSEGEVTPPFSGSLGQEIRDKRLTVEGRLKGQLELLYLIYFREFSFPYVY